MPTDKCLDCEPLFPTYLSTSPPECVGEPCTELYNADCIVYEPAIVELVLPVKSRLSVVIAALVAKLGSAGGLQVQSDFNQTDDTQPDFIKNKPTIPVSYTDTMADARVVAGITGKVNTVAGKGLSTEDYSSLEKEKLVTIETSAQVNVKPDWTAEAGSPAEILNKPTLATGQVQSDWDQIDAGENDFIKHKPTIPDAQVESDWDASSGLGVILHKPTIPAAQIQSDWNAITGVNQILNKPIIPATQVQSDWNAVTGITQILNKPTIPAAQIQSDWNASTGMGVIGNKPSIPSISGLISSSTITVIQALTQIEYDAITTPLTTTLYFIR